MTDANCPPGPPGGDDYRRRVKHSRADAESYRHRKPLKHRAEMDMIRRALPGPGGGQTVLDAPCGVGRASFLLAGRGYAVTGIDLGAGAIELAREEAGATHSDARFLLGNVERMPFADRQFDATLCFRLYHHFPDDAARDRVIDELCRVTQSRVLISYLSPLAVTSIRRAIAQRLGGRRSRQHATSLASIEEKFARNGFRLLGDIPRRRFLHTLHLAEFGR